MPTATLEPPTETETKPETAVQAEERSGHVLMPLRIVRDETAPRGHKVRVERYYSGIDENREVQRATIITGRPPMSVRGKSLSEIEKELLERVPYPEYTHLRGGPHVNAFVLGDDAYNFPIHDQGGTRVVRIMAANFYTLVDVEQGDIDAEYICDEHVRELGIRDRSPKR